MGDTAYKMSKTYKEICESNEKGRIHADWDSLSSFRIPAWFEDAKFGIFIHWGVFSVPAFNNEWYSRSMYVKGSPEYEHHIKTYGPHDKFGYKDFIPMFRAEEFDPEYWAEVFAQAGARYVVPVAEHHDGFQMYDSDLSGYCASKMGPKRDVLGELKKSVENRGLVFGTSTHRAEHYFFMGPGRDFESDIHEPLNKGDLYWPSLSEQPNTENVFDRYAPKSDFLEDWVERTCEIIDKYSPRVLYFDWWIQHKAYKPYLRQIMAYYYNHGEEHGYPTAICYKHEALAFGTGIVDVERGKFAEAKPYHWQTDTAIARNSWCYTTNLDYKSSGEIIQYLADVVATNGNLLLNVGPKSDGTFAGEDLSILLDIGEWLNTNGEAIYDSKPWRYAEEGPTAESEGMFTDGKATEYTSADIRYTAGHGAVYAIFLRCPEDGHFDMKSVVRAGDKNSFIVKNVSVLGYEGKQKFKIDGSGLHFVNKDIKSRFPVVVRIETE